MAKVYNRCVDVGRKGKVSSFDFIKLSMDKDFIWRIEILLNKCPDEVDFSYKASFVLSPENANEQIEARWKEYEGKQMQLGGENALGNLYESIDRISEKYYGDAVLFKKIDFEARLVKFEKKPYGKGKITFAILNDAAMDIAKIRDQLELSAIVLLSNEAEEE